MTAQPKFRRSIEESIVLTLFDLANHLSKSGELMSREIGLTVKEWILLLQVAGDPNFPVAYVDGPAGLGQSMLFDGADDGHQYIDLGTFNPSGIFSAKICEFISIAARAMQ